MTVAEIRAAINFGIEYIEQCKNNNQDPTPWVYDRLIELYEELVEKLNIGG